MKLKKSLLRIHQNTVAQGAPSPPAFGSRSSAPMSARAPNTSVPDYGLNTSVPDYGSYTLSRRERLLFEGIGFISISFIVFLFYRSLLLAGLAGLLIRRCQPLYERYMARKRLGELNQQFQDLLTSLSASITAGRQMEEALVEACDNLSLMYEPQAPIMMELRFMKKSILENHESDRTLLTDFARRTGSEDIVSFVQVYLTCRNTGGDLQRIISHTSEILSEKMKICEQINAITAQKKLEGRMISLMPAAMLLMLNLMSPAYISILYTCAAGRLIMTFCLGAVIAGVVLMERLADIQI